MNKFLIKGFAFGSLMSSICSVGNFCSAHSEFPSWFYGEGEFPSDKKEWFAEELIIRLKKLCDACDRLGRDFSEKNKFEVKECMSGVLKFKDACCVRSGLFGIFGDRVDLLNKIESFFRDNKEKIENVPNPERVQEFCEDLCHRWIPGSFGAGF